MERINEQKPIIESPTEKKQISYIFGKAVLSNHQNAVKLYKENNIFFGTSRVEQLLDVFFGSTANKLKSLCWGYQKGLVKKVCWSP